MKNLFKKHNINNSLTVVSNFIFKEIIPFIQQACLKLFKRDMSDFYIVTKRILFQINVSIKSCKN